MRQCASAKDVFFTPISQRHGPDLGRFKQSFDLQAHELVFALAQRARRDHAFLLDQRVQLLAQGHAGDADKAPRLHEAHAGRMVRSGQQAAHHLRRHRTAAKVAHITPLENGAVHRVALDGRKSHVRR